MIAPHEITDAIRAPRAGHTFCGFDLSRVCAVVGANRRPDGESRIGERRCQQHALVVDA